MGHSIGRRDPLVPPPDWDRRVRGLWRTLTYSPPLLFRHLPLVLLIVAIILAYGPIIAELVLLPSNPEGWHDLSLRINIIACMAVAGLTGAYLITRSTHLVPNGLVLVGTGLIAFGEHQLDTVHITSVFVMLLSLLGGSPLLLRLLVLLVWLGCGLPVSHIEGQSVSGPLAVGLTASVLIGMLFYDWLARRSQSSAERAQAAADATAAELQIQMDAVRRIVESLHTSLLAPLASLHLALSGLARYTPPASPLFTLVAQAKSVESELKQTIWRLTRGLEYTRSPIRPRLAPVQIGRLVAEVREQLGVRDTLEVQFASHAATALVWADPRQLLLLLYVVLDNASRYGARCVCIAVASGSDAGGTPVVELRITDDGEGIDQEDLPHVLRRLYRGRNARWRTDRPGLGLGLSVAASIVVAHGGTIAVQSTLGEGTTVLVRLPQEPPP